MQKPADGSVKRRPPLVQTPRMQQSVEFWFTPVEAATEWFHQYGDAYSFHPIASQPIDFLCHPRYFKAIAEQEANFLTGEGNKVLGGFESVFGERSLVVLDGPEHRATRKWVTDAILLANNKPVINGLMKGRPVIHEQLDRWQIDKPILLYKEMRSIATRLMCQVVLGRDLPELASDLCDLLETAVTPQSWLIHHKRKLRDIDNVLYSVIAECRANPRTGENLDVLSTLIETMEDRTSQDLHDTVLTLLVLGHEGASATVSWALYYAATVPEVLPYIETDIRSLAGKDVILVADLSAASSLDNVIRETLRMRSPLIAVQRMATCPLEIDDIDVGAGDIVCPSMYLMHRNEEVWKDADRFMHDRFATLSDDDTRHRFQPFGVGQRSCPGRRVGYAEIKILLAEILSRFGGRLRPAKNYVPGIQRRGNLLTPLEDMPFVVDP